VPRVSFEIERAIANTFMVSGVLRGLTHVVHRAERCRTFWAKQY